MCFCLKGINFVEGFVVRKKVFLKYSSSIMWKNIFTKIRPIYREDRAAPGAVDVSSANAACRVKSIHAVHILKNIRKKIRVSRRELRLTSDSTWYISQHDSFGALGTGYALGMTYMEAHVSGHVHSAQALHSVQVATLST